MEVSIWCKIVCWAILIIFWQRLILCTILWDYWGSCICMFFTMLSLMKCLVAILFWEYLHFFKLRKCYYWDIIDKELRWKYPSPLSWQNPIFFRKSQWRASLILMSLKSPTNSDDMYVWTIFSKILTMWYFFVINFRCVKNGWNPGAGDLLPRCSDEDPCR